MSNGKTNRNKGHNAERHYVNEFKEMGFDKCVTARFGSKMYDDAGIDLINLPLNVQIKAGFQKGMNPTKVLGIIKERIPTYFMDNDPVHNNINIVIHKKQVKQGQKRTEFDELVYMSFSDFKKLMAKVDWNQK